jgi:hypothetical protein
MRKLTQIPPIKKISQHMNELASLWFHEISQDLARNSLISRLGLQIYEIEHDPPLPAAKHPRSQSYR